MSAGVNTELELKQARRTLLQAQLLRLQGNDQRVSLRNHLSQLLGTSAEQLETASASVPPFPLMDLIGRSTDAHNFDTPQHRVRTGGCPLQERRGQSGFPLHMETANRIRCRVWPHQSLQWRVHLLQPEAATTTPPTPLYRSSSRSLTETHKENARAAVVVGSTRSAHRSTIARAATGHKD